MHALLSVWRERRAHWMGMLPICSIRFRLFLTSIVPTLETKIPTETPRETIGKIHTLWTWLCVVSYQQLSSSANPASVETIRSHSSKRGGGGGGASSIHQWHSQTTNVRRKTRDILIRRRRSIWNNCRNRAYLIVSAACDHETLKSRISSRSSHMALTSLREGRPWGARLLVVCELMNPFFHLYIERQRTHARHTTSANFPRTRRLYVPLL